MKQPIGNISKNAVKFPKGKGFGNEYFLVEEEGDGRGSLMHYSALLQILRQPRH